MFGRALLSHRHRDQLISLVEISFFFVSPFPSSPNFTGAKSKQELLDGLIIHGGKQTRKEEKKKSERSDETDICWESLGGTRFDGKEENFL